MGEANITGRKHSECVDKCLKLFSHIDKGSYAWYDENDFDPEKNEMDHRHYELAAALDRLGLAENFEHEVGFKAAFGELFRRGGRAAGIKDVNYKSLYITAGESFRRYCRFMGWDPFFSKEAVENDSQESITPMDVVTIDMVGSSRK